MNGPVIWLNKNFSGVYNVIRLLRSPSAPVPMTVWCTHTNPEFVGFEASDLGGVEPTGLTGAAYVRFCLEFCVRQEIDLLIPGKERNLIARHRADFARIGTNVLLTASPDNMALFEDKVRFYECLKESHVPTPRAYTVNSTQEFLDACERLKAEGAGVCFKPSRSTGGLGFRIIDDTRTETENLLGGEPIRITTRLAAQILAEQPRFRDVLVMEYLDGPEYSLDCLAQHGQLLRCVPRKKPRRIGGAQLLENNLELVSAARRLTADFGLHALFNVQFRYGASGARLLEINARMSGGIYFSCLSGVNLPAWAIALELGRAREEDMPQPRFGLKVSEQQHEFVLQNSPRELTV